MSESCTLDLFAPVTGAAKRDAALAANDAAVSAGAGGDLLVARVTAHLLDRVTFTADDVAVLLDEQGVPTDLVTRRRLTSVIVNRGRTKWWTPDGYAPSHDPRRNSRPITRWRVVAV